MQLLNINAEVYNSPPTTAARGAAVFFIVAVSSSLNLPSFWLKRPHTRFNICESAFATCNIQLPLTKYLPSLRGQAPCGDSGQHRGRREQFHSVRWLLQGPQTVPLQGTWLHRAAEGQ